MSTVDDRDLSTVTAAELPDAPFPDSRVPTATVYLEAADGKPDAFGDNASAAPDVADSVLEGPDPSAPIPNNFEEQVKTFSSTDGGNELDNTAVAEFYEANSTSAESLSIPPKEKVDVAKAEEPKAEEPAEEAKVEEAKEEEPAPRRGRGRKPAADSE